MEDALLPVHHYIIFIFDLNDCLWHFVKMFVYLSLEFCKDCSNVVMTSKETCTRHGI